MPLDKSDTPSAPKPQATTKAGDKLESVGLPNPESLRVLAEDLPERDEVQRAVKDGMLADTAQGEAKAKAKVVDASPDASETPSGAALKKVTGITNDQERGEKYLREKSAMRWGYVPADGS